MSKKKVIRVSDDELAALEIYRNTVKAGSEAEHPVKEQPKQTESYQALADAFVQAIERTKPPEKKTIINRKVKTPWFDSSTEQRAKMKRKYYHHGMLIGERLSNDEINLLNQVKPGRFCEGHVRVELRKDRGIDIDYPIATSSQRLKLVNQFGIRSFTELLRRIIDEKTNPTKYRKPEDADLYDLDQ